MTENKRPWTAGTWTLDSTVRTAINAPDSKHIAMVSYCQGMNGVSAEEHEANARLLAAAPTLYEVLEAYVKETELKIKCAGTAGHLQKPYDAAIAALRAANPDAFESAEGEGE